MTTAPPASQVFTYLTLATGPRAGSSILLVDHREFHLGRTLDCYIVLEDPVCSRLHAVVYRTSDGWFVRDQNSRNGTFVNGQKIDEARLLDGSSIRIGSTEYIFHQSATPPPDAVRGDSGVTQTIIRDAPIASDTGKVLVSALKDAERAKDFLTLHQLSLQLLACDDPDQVMRTALELILERAQASMAGFLWVNDEGKLRPRMVVPAEAHGQPLSASLTEIVCQQGRAIWIDNSSAATNSESLSHFADAICVPLMHGKDLLGAIHIYLEQGRFKQSDFDFAIALANIVVVALARARQEAALRADHRRLVDKSACTNELIGESKPMQDLKNKITRIARATGCVLIRGESGAGKELVACAIHKSSNRAGVPMLSVNCAAIPRDLMESQLFGHRKGAFTSADSDHIGWFQQADGGTLFLDEVGEMTLEGQAKLLRILEGHPFMPVGATKEVTVDVRVIAATNRDLRDFVRDGKFREDLYYRLSVFELHVPPLRDRGADIEVLMDYFFDHFKRQHGRPNLQVSETARRKLLGYQWPGNVRQLRNVIDSCVVMVEGNEIQPDDLGLRDAGGGELETLNLEHWERKLIREALTRTGGSKPEAAKLLGIGRATLYRKIEEYAIDR